MLTIFWLDFLFVEYFEHKPTLLPAKYLKGLLKSIKAKSLAAKNPKMFYNDARRTLLEVEKLSFSLLDKIWEKKDGVMKKESKSFVLYTITEQLLACVELFILWVQTAERFSSFCR